MNLIRISAVSYLNTKPFIYGIENTDIANKVGLSLDIPSMCAEKLINDEVDISLVPIAILPQLKEYHLLTDYCIGSTGSVKSVALYSEVPLNEIDSIIIDYQSKTSALLIKILAKFFWKISPQWIDEERNNLKKIEGYNAGLIIGDRTLRLQNKYKYSYDLGEAWTVFTGLPFIYAAWVSKKRLNEVFIKKFNSAMEFGVNNKVAVAKKYIHEYDGIDVQNYLENFISYSLDDEKRKGMKLFLDYSSQLK